MPMPRNGANRCDAIPNLKHRTALEAPPKSVTAAIGRNRARNEFSRIVGHVSASVGGYSKKIVVSLGRKASLAVNATA
jgi:hypothetical protein